MTNDEIIKLLKIEKECIAHSGECNRQCNKCDLVQDTNKLLEMYDCAIYFIESVFPQMEVEYPSIVEHNRELFNKNEKLKKELKKRRKEKKRWKRMALKFKEASDNWEQAAENWKQTCHVYEVGLTNMRNRIKKNEREDAKNEKD